MELRDAKRSSILDLVEKMQFKNRFYIDGCEFIPGKVDVFTRILIMKHPEQVISSRDIIRKGLSEAPSDEEFGKALDEAEYMLNRSNDASESYDFGRILRYLAKHRKKNWKMIELKKNGGQRRCSADLEKDFMKICRWGGGLLVRQED